METIRLKHGQAYLFQVELDDDMIVEKVISVEQTSFSFTRNEHGATVMSDIEFNQMDRDKWERLSAPTTPLGTYAKQIEP